MKINEKKRTTASGSGPLRTFRQQKNTSDRSDVLSGDKGIRTPDLLNAIQTRSQLRHTPRYEYYNTRLLRILQGLCA